MARQIPDTEVDAALKGRDILGLVRMLDDGLNPDWKNAEGASLLHAAARIGDISLVDKLLEKGARTLVHNADNETPHEVAIIWGNGNAAKAIERKMADEKLTRGTDAIPYKSLQEIRDKSAATGVNELHALAKRGQFPQVVALALADPQGLSAAELLEKGPDGDSALMKICQHGQVVQLAKPELWMKKPQELQRLWENLPSHYKKDVDFSAIASQMTQLRLQSYGKPKLKGFQKPK